MNKNVFFGGLDVHAETIVIAVSRSGAEPPQVLKTIPYDERRLLAELRRLAPLSSWKVCYEAGPTGFGLQRFLKDHGVECVVVAPSLVPVKSGVRLKTDRRDACKLAHCLRNGDLAPIWIPDGQTEAIRDLERAREDARLAERRARQQLLKFLLRHSRRFSEGKRHWTQRHWIWIRQQQFDHEALNRVLADYVQTAQQARDRIQRLTVEIRELISGWALEGLVKNLQAFHGIQLVTAVALAAEVGDFHRFATARRFMGFLGLIPSEHSTGGTRKQGGITKTGNRHVRRLLVEAAWHYYDCRPGISVELEKRRAGVPSEVVAIADKAKLRLRRKALNMKLARKLPTKIVTALARELAGFVWAAALASTPAGQNESRSDRTFGRRRRTFRQAAAGVAGASERNGGSLRPRPPRPLAKSGSGV
jgi:transposase